LPTATIIGLYEIVFSDRVIAQDLSSVIDISTGDKKELKKSLKQNIDKAQMIIKKYPQYYHEVLSKYED